MDKQSIYKIKEQVLKTLTGMNLSASRLILFGSRAREDFSAYSDYDILVVTNTDLQIQEKMSVSKILREDLARFGFDIDVIIKSENEVTYYASKYGSIVRNALKEGVAL